MTIKLNDFVTQWSCSVFSAANEKLIGSVFSAVAQTFRLEHVTLVLQGISLTNRLILNWVYRSGLYVVIKSPLQEYVWLWERYTDTNRY